MGIIKKQALQSTIINFIGIGFGSVSRMAMPFVLTQKQLGLVELLNTISGIFVVVFNMGYNLIIKKLFPRFRNNSKGHSGFLMLGILLSIFGSFTAFIAFYFGQDYLFSNKATENPIILQYAFLVPILIFFRILYVNIDGYVRILYKTVIGVFIESFVTKVLLLVFLVLVAKSVILFNAFVYAYSFTLIVPGILIVIYSFFITEKVTMPKKEIFSKDNKVKSLVLFGILSGSSASIVQYIDTLMIYKIMPVNPEESVAIYSIMLFASLLILVPAKSLNKISSVVLADSWKDKNLENIEMIYRKSCVNLLIVGGFLFLVGWACIDAALFYLPDYKLGKYVFFMLGIGRVIELGTGVNTDVIETSEKYKFNTYFNIILAVIILILNYIFITFFGILGAAAATMIGILIINIFKALLLRNSYNFRVFKRNFWVAALVIIALTAIITIVDYDAHPILKILLNATVVATVFWVTIYKLKLSTDINESIDRVWKKVSRIG